MNGKNQRDESTPLVVDHGNTTEEEGTKMSMITMATTIRRSPKALLLLGLAATAAVSNTAWNQYQTSPPLAQLNKSETGSGPTIVTMVNNCPNTQVLYSKIGDSIKCEPSECGKLVTDGANAFYLGEKPFNKFRNNNNGAATTIEFTPVSDGVVDVDISKIKGFNYGVSIKDKAGAWSLVCNGVNCKDAYWLCDDAQGNNLFSPNAMFSSKEVIVTWCPQGEADTDYFHSTNSCNGEVQNAQAADTKGPYICQFMDWYKIEEKGGTCVNGPVVNGKCKWKNKPVYTCESGGGGDTPTPSSSCTPRGGDAWYHPGAPGHFQLACCAGLHEVNENSKIICR